MRFTTISVVAASTALAAPRIRVPNQGPITEVLRPGFVGLPGIIGGPKAPPKVDSNVFNTESNGLKNVVYWGQNAEKASENNDLATYCNDKSGIDTVLLAFLSNYGRGGLVPGGNIGLSCSINTKGEAKGCEALGKAIATCQSRGIKVLLSLAGASGQHNLASKDEAEKIGQNLWDAYGNGKGNVPRPFGATAVDGFDFDVENNNKGNEFYVDLLKKLRSNFASDKSRQYLITGAPQCPVPDTNMNNMIKKTQFDHLYIQFYNTDSCSAGAGKINMAQWKKDLQGSASANAKLFLGVPAAPLAATGSLKEAKYFVKPEKLASQVAELKGDGSFGGTMMWNAAFSDSNVSNGCTYAQQAKRILTTGKPC